MHETNPDFMCNTTATAYNIFEHFFMCAIQKKEKKKIAKASAFFGLLGCQFTKKNLP